MTINKQEFHSKTGLARLAGFESGYSQIRYWILDAKCWMVAHSMADKWIIRVQGKDYGPADIETLREWKTEGRLLPRNEARRVDADLWSTAVEIPGLFDVAVAVSAAGKLTQPPLQRPRRSSMQIMADTFRIYGKGFFQFFSLTLLLILPSVCGQLTTVWTETAGPNARFDLRTLVTGVFVVCMSVLTMVLWPIYIAGIQILSAEMIAGRRISFLSALNETVRFWPRVTLLCIFVYGIFFLLTVFAFGIAVIVAAGASSLSLIFLALALLVLQVWMFGRFFINVLFWQQFAVLENAGVVDSLRESRNLARSGRDLPWFRRPSWRGVFIASIWFVFVLAITLGPEWTMLHHYFNEFMTTQDPQALVQKLTASQQAHGFNIVSFAMSILQKILQPLLGIAFVLLYFDSKSDRPSETDS
jgi:hypothetical protein